LYSLHALAFVTMNRFRQKCEVWCGTGLPINFFVKQNLKKEQTWRLSEMCQIITHSFPVEVNYSNVFLSFYGLIYTCWLRPDVSTVSYGTAVFEYRFCANQPHATFTLAAWDPITW